MSNQRKLRIYRWGGSLFILAGVLLSLTHNLIFARPTPVSFLPALLCYLLGIALGILDYLKSVCPYCGKFVRHGILVRSAESETLCPHCGKHVWREDG